MQRFVNDPDFIVDDMLSGLVKANPEVELSERNNRVIKLAASGSSKKTGLVTGGGSGHEPAFLGYIGNGLLDAVAVGEVFSSPPAQAFYDAIHEADNGNGVAVLFGNYAGDNMNVKMAVQMAEDDDISVKYIVANDDIASSPKETKEKRHGIAGGFFMWKAGGARAALGGTLDEVIKSAKNVVEKTRSICVGLSPCTIPAVGKPNFQIEDGTMETGVGHHGEAGIKTEPLKPADDIAKDITNAILEDFDFSDKRELAVMISGLGSTPVMELYVLYNKVEEVLKEKGHKIYKAYIGNFVTSLDMNGASLTIVDLDDEIKTLLEQPAVPVGIKNY
jgi:dihydroxyacetone kinase-like protein